MKLRMFTAGLVILLPVSLWSQDTSRAVPTFTQNVMPILQDHCQSCHRPGEIAPMSLMSYEEARPWAASIKEKVSKRVMPPWFADPKIAEYANDRRLSDAEIQTIVRWVEGGAPRGNPADLPAPRKFTQGWSIGKPDAIFTMVQGQKVIGSGMDEYIYFAIPMHFNEDKFVQAVEIRPGNRQIVHHVLAYIQKEGAGVPSRANVEAYNRRVGLDFFRAEGLALRVNDAAPVYDDSCTLPNGGAALSGDVSSEARPLIAGYAPGSPPRMTPPGVAQRIPAGSEILLQIHYVKTGKEEFDQTSVGLIFAKQPAKQLLLGRWIMNMYFKIPPNTSNHEAKACYTFDKDADVVSFVPHMHVRGKDMQYKAFYPDGRSEVIFNIPAYDFNWQLEYIAKTPIHLPKGTRVEVTAHYDNSVGRKRNPNSGSAVRWGDPTTDEMLIGEMYYVLSNSQSKR